MSLAYCLRRKRRWRFIKSPMFGTHKNYFLIFLVIQCSSTKTYINTVYLLGGNHWCISLRLGLGATLTDGDCTSSQTQGERRKKKKRRERRRGWGTSQKPTIVCERRGGKNVFRSRERKIIHNSCVCAESRGENYHLLSKILINWWDLIFKRKKERPSMFEILKEYVLGTNFKGIYRHCFGKKIWLLWWARLKNPFFVSSLLYCMHSAWGPN